MAKVRVVRPNDRGGRLRSLVVMVDGKRVGRLRPLSDMVIDVVPGHHEIYGQMDWARSPSIVVDATEGVEVTVELSLPFRAVVDSFLRPSKAIRSRIIT